MPLPQLRQLGDGRVRRRLHGRRRRARRQRRSTCRWSARSAAGQATLLALSPGTAVKIMTGAPIPQGCTAVVPVRVDRPGRRARCRSAGPRPRASTSGTPGEDVREGDVLVSRAARCSAPARSGCSPASGRAACGPGRGRGWWSMSTGTELREPGTRSATTRSTTPTPTCSPPRCAPPAAIAYRVGAVVRRPRGVHRGADRPAGPRRHRGHQRRRQPGRLRRGQGGAVPSWAPCGSARSRCSRASRRASASSARTRRRSSRCRATRSRRTSPSRLFVLPALRKMQGAGAVERAAPATGPDHPRRLRRSAASSSIVRGDVPTSASVASPRSAATGRT